MANCKQVTYTPQEFRNRVLNKELVYTTYPDQTQEITVEYLQHSAQQVKIGEVRNEKGELENMYVDTPTGQKLLDNRVTDEQAKQFRKKKGAEEAKRISNLPNNVIKRDTGIFIHGVLQQIMQGIIDGKGDTHFEKLRLEARNSEFRLNATDFAMLRKGAQDIFDHIQKTQNEINEKTGTNGKAQIFLEQVVVDPVKSVGGTMDVVVVFSDNTASLYDYKTMRASAKQTAVINGAVQLINDLVPAYKFEGYNLQLGEYQRILQQMYGIKDIRESRIVPVMTQNVTKTREQNPTKDDFLTQPVSLIQMGVETSPYLEQIAINEKTGIPGLDKLIQGQMNVIERLNQQVQTASKQDKDAIYKRISTITRGLNRLMVRRDINTLLVEIVELSKKLREELTAPKTMNGEINPDYIYTKQLIDYRDQLTLYEHIVKDLSLDLEKFQKENVAEDKKEENLNKMFDRLSIIQGEVSRTQGLVQHEMEVRATIQFHENELTSEGFLKPQKGFGLYEQTIARHSQIDNPVFRRTKELFDQAFWNRDKALTDTFEEIEEVMKALSQWAKDNGMTTQKAFMKLVNIKTGDLHPMLRQEFWNERKVALETRDVSWVKSHYEIDEAKFKEKYERRLAAFRTKQLRDNNNGKDLLINGVVVKSGEQYRRAIESNVKDWIRENDLLSSSEAWLNKNNIQYQMTIKKDVLERYKSAEYRFIEQNKPLMNYYNMFEKYMDYSAKVFGFNRSELPPNFVPWIRKDALDRLIQDGLGNIGSSMSEIKESFKLRDEDIYLKNQDLTTGEKRRHIPILFYHPITDENGTKRIDEKSFDLSNVLMNWMKVVYNYQFMSAVEGDVLALKEYIAGEHYSEYQTNSRGKKLLHRAGGFATKRLGAASDASQALNKIIDFQMYGIRYGEGGVMGGTSKAGYSTKKGLLALKNYYSITRLGFGFFPGFAAFSQGHVSAIIEAKKGQAFNMKHWANVPKLLVKDNRLMRGFCDYFHVYAEDQTYKRAQKLSAKHKTKIFSSRTAFLPIRIGDESVDDTILISMIQNYGIDVNGNLARLAHLPAGTKSLLELGSMVDGKFKLAISDQAAIQFRRAVREVTLKIKGTMNDEDVAQHNLNLAMSLAMQFKTWIPGVLEERFGKLSYSETLDAVNYGRFRAYFSEYEHLQGASWLEYTSKILLPNISKLILDIGTFGISNKLGLKRVNEKLARQHFDRWRVQEENEYKVDAWYRAAFKQWKRDNANSSISFQEWITRYSDVANKMLYDQFLDAKQRQIKAMVNELRIVIGLMVLLTAMGAKAGDDDNPWYYDTWLGRTTNKALSRALTELAFVYNPTELIRLTSSPMPVMGLLSQAWKTTKNGVDEMRDAVFGENSSRDQSPLGYYTGWWVPGIKQMSTFIEFYEQNKKNPYTLGGNVW